MWADPTAYGFTNLTSAANACVGCDPNQYFWWDAAHFTAAAHRLIASEMYRCLTPPLVIALPTGGASGVLELQWQGGSPPFRASALRGPGHWLVAIGRAELCDQRHDGVLGPATVLPRLAVGAMRAKPIP